MSERFPIPTRAPSSVSRSGEALRELLRPQARAAEGEQGRSGERPGRGRRVAPPRWVSNHERDRVRAQPRRGLRCWRERTATTLASYATQARGARPERGSHHTRETTDRLAPSLHRRLLILREPPEQHLHPVRRLRGARVIIGVGAVLQAPAVPLPVRVIGPVPAVFLKDVDAV